MTVIEVKLHRRQREDQSSSVLPVGGSPRKEEERKGQPKYRFQGGGGVYRKVPVPV